MTDRRSDRTDAGRSAPLDADLAALLREAYAPPADDTYWAGLETRIMARVRSAPAVATEWWHVLSEWRTAGLVAAGLLLSLAGASLLHEQRLASQARELAAGAAYWTVFDGATDGTAIAFTVSPSTDPDERIVDRYLYVPEP